jgi:hypothetical protein
MLEFTNGTVAPPLYTLGVDLGDAKDHTAICILERPLWVGGEDWKYMTTFVGGPEDGGWVAPDELGSPINALNLAYINMLYGRPAYPTFRVRHVERLPLGSGYPKVIKTVSGYMQRLADYHPELLVDHTGVGRPIVQSFRNEGLFPVGIHLHAGADVRFVDFENRYNVPVRELVTSAQVMLEHGRLQIASSLEHAGTLKKELLSFRRKINPQTAHESFSAWREKDHDDLVFALSMCVWWHAHTTEHIEVSFQDDYCRLFGEVW